MRQFLIRFYPAVWRARYGDEFDALLEERPLGPFDVADIILGAIDARLRLRGRGASPTTARGFTMSLRIGGIAAIVAGAAWGLTFVGSTGILGDSDRLIQYAVFALALLSLLVALIGLSAFQAREHSTVIWAAVALPVVGTVVALVGLVAMTLLDDAQLVAGVSAWNLWIFGLMAAVFGSGLFAIATYQTRTLSRPGSALLGFGSFLTLPTLVITGEIGFDAVGAVAIVTAIVGFSVGWIVLGVAAIRTMAPAVDPQPA